MKAGEMTLAYYDGEEVASRLITKPRGTSGTYPPPVPALHSNTGSGPSKLPGLGTPLPLGKGDRLRSKSWGAGAQEGV